MPSELQDLFFDPAGTAGELTAALEQHKASVAPRVPAPDPRPLFTRAPDGAIVDRAGNTLRPAVQP